MGRAVMPLARCYCCSCVWQRLSWGPLFWTRRLACWVLGHDWVVEHACELDFQGSWYCRRCMEEP